MGIIAGGQLGKMLILAASNWDIKTVVLDADEECPAASCCTQFVKGHQLSYDDIMRFGEQVDMITFEMENVNIKALKDLKAAGKAIFPDPDTLEIIQDKGLQKEFYKKNNIPSPSFSLYKTKDEIVAAVKSGAIAFPFVQKLRQGGYDGKGVAVIRSVDGFDNLLDGPSVVEQLIDIQKEISVIVAQNRKGEVRCFPAVEMEFNGEANLVEQLICPTSLSESILTKANDIAVELIKAFDMCGLLAIELFVDQNNTIWVNEVAPRPHNSGHHTIESSVTSQYEQMLRAILNYPLGNTDTVLPSVMLNLLGEPKFEGPVFYEGFEDCLAIEGVNIHLYGKRITKPFRKMGHVTIVSATIEEALEKAQIVKQTLKVKSW